VAVTHHFFEKELVVKKKVCNFAVGFKGMKDNGKVL
jgi:hypothetical protein